MKTYGECNVYECPKCKTELIKIEEELKEKEKYVPCVPCDGDGLLPTNDPSKPNFCPDCDGWGVVERVLG